jgi:Creatinine amidohydrolase
MFRIYFSCSLTTLKSEEKQAPELPTPSFRLKNANNRSQDREVLHATSIHEMDSSEGSLLFQSNCLGAAWLHRTTQPAFASLSRHGRDHRAGSARLEERSDRVVLLPTLWLGHSPHHRFFACLSLDLRTYMDVIIGLCDSLVLPGFRKILFLNGHGGNEIAKAALREVKSKYESNHDLKIGFASYWALGQKTLGEVRESALGVLVTPVRWKRP